MENVALFAVNGLRRALENRRWPVEGGEMDLIAIYIFLWFGLFPKSFGRHLGIILAATRPTASTSQEQEP